MNFSAINSACAGAASIGDAVAHPGMAKIVDEIKANVMSSQGGPVDPTPNSSELIGDLLTLQDSQLAPVAMDIKATILSQAIGESLETYPNVPKLGTSQWAAVRLGFHDAAGWSKSTGPTGGTDGSLILAPEDIRRPGNRGLEEIVTLTQSWFTKYKRYGMSAADPIQRGANVATGICPLGSRTKTYTGRKDLQVRPRRPAPACRRICRLSDQAVRDKTIQPNGLVAHLGAHSTAPQRPNAPARVFKFASDIELASDPGMSGLFTAFAATNNAAQLPWSLLYAREYVRLRLLGVNNINSLTDCTKVLPQPVRTFVPNDRGEVNTWMSSTKIVPAITNALLDRKLITSVPGLSSLLSNI